MAVKVAAEKCGSYEKAQVRETICRLLGAIEPIDIGEGDRVLVKPNLLSARDPEDGVTTHPSVVAGVVRYLAGKGVKVMIGDCPCNRRSSADELWERTGMREAAEETGAELVNLDARPAARVESLGMELYLTPYALEADAVVSVAKMKTHDLTGLTCAVKNLFGLVPGFGKLEWHKKCHRVRDFSRLLAAILAAVRPKLAVVDGIVAMEGNGPTNGGLRDAGLLLASRDAVAVDSVCAYAMGFGEGAVEHLRLGGELSLGEARLEEIEVEGAGLSELRIPSFRRPRASVQAVVPEFLARPLHRFIWVRPKFAERCKGCGLCVENCPAGALRMVDSRPVLAPERCIECFCCDEICPHGAVELKHGFLARFFV